jgi:hypothetical protein
VQEEKMMYVTSAVFKGKKLLYQPTKKLLEVVKKKYAGRFSKNKRIRKKQVHRFANEIISQALELFADGFKNKTTKCD